MDVYVNDPQTGEPVKRTLTGDEMPCQIGVYCDACGHVAEHDYVVRESMTPTERFEVARAHLREHEGWECGTDGDYCPKCKALIKEGE